MTVIALYIREVILYIDGKNLPRAADHHDYYTRHPANYPLPAHHLTLYERKPSYAGKKLYNILPQELKALIEMKLKASLNDWLTSRPFYTLDEYVHWKDIQE
ncbi:uncharacterized protein LOC124375204 [Homalodisca vitripennis]|uniref:uncharacterized protein LOC124375204 n=1 Tax=Homalodisca vitripennis TaxID=197043 RepID=UPI001EEC4982|nr:uncharacterized protein LOC124375204 [Homalodisca vitripennis]